MEGSTTLGGSGAFNMGEVIRGHFQLSLHDIVPYMMQFANICKWSALTHALVTAGCIHHTFLGEIFSI